MLEGATNRGQGVFTGIFYKIYQVPQWNLHESTPSGVKCVGACVDGKVLGSRDCKVGVGYTMES